MLCPLQFRVVMNVLYKIRSPLSSPTRPVFFTKDFIRRSDCREASVAHFLHCLCQRRVGGDSLLSHDVSRYRFEKVHASFLACFLCCFHVSHYIDIIGISQARSLVILEKKENSCKSLVRKELRRARRGPIVVSPLIPTGYVNFFYLVF
jgi:hypothetical protein